jgi:hypothetical protein
MDLQDLGHGGFLFLPLLVVLQNYEFSGYLQTLLYYPYYFWILKLFVCGLNNLFTLLRQKWRVFVILDEDCIFNPMK